MNERRGALGRAARWVADHELAVVLALAPFLLFPAALSVATAAALAALPALWAIRWLARGRLTRRTSLDGPILALMALVPLSVIVSPYPELSLPKAVGLALGLALYYALVNHRDALALARWLPLLGWAVVALGLVGIDWVVFKLPVLTPIYQHLPRLIQGVPRTMSGGFHPNEVGGTLAMLIPAVAALWPERGEASAGGRLRALVGSRGFILLTLAAMAGLLLLTQSRAAIAATALALAFLGAVRWRWVRCALAAAAILAVGLVMWRGPAAILDAVLSLPGSHTWAGRPEIWGNALRAWRDFPLTGVGLNAFEPVSRARYAYLIAPPTWDFVHAHNILLQIGVDLGLVGLAAFIALLVALGIVGLRAGKLAGWRGRLAGGLLASVVAYLAFGLIDAITLGAKPSAWLWAAAGLLGGMSLEAPSQSAPGRARRAGRWAAPAASAALGVAALLLHSPLASLALGNWGQLAINHQLYPQAVGILERAVALDEGNGSAQWGLAEAYAGVGREEEALHRWRIAGADPKELAERGQAARLAGQLEAAEAWLRRALTLDAMLSEGWYYLGLLRADRGRHGEAVQALRKALETGHSGDALPADARRVLGILLLAEGSIPEATSHFRAMLAEDPGDIRTRFDLAQALSLAGDYPAARAELEAGMAALEAGRTAGDALQYAALRLELAVALTTNANRQDDLAAAQRWGKLAKQLEPRHAFPYTDLAELYLRHGLHAEALEECRALLQIRQDVPGIHYLLGEALAGAGEPAAAIPAYQEAIRLRPDIARFQYALAAAQAASGDAAAAARTLEQARKLGPDAPLSLTGHSRRL